MASSLGAGKPQSNESSSQRPGCRVDAETPQEPHEVNRPRSVAPPEPKQRGGYDCEFVETPQELQGDCPICLGVLREPFQVTCCGNSFCRTCIKLIQTKEKACPTCNEANFSAFPNKGLQRSLYSFRVQCVHQKSGCEWTGELGELDGHLNVNPELGKQLDGCGFVAVMCTHCYKYFQRRHVHAHESESCPQRPFSCDYCKDYRSVYQDVVNNHWPVCKCYPVPCPNECGVSPERQNVKTHVNTACPLTVVNCDFHYAGCEVQLVRKDMPNHLAESLATHISLLTTQTQTLAGRGGQDNLLPHLSLLALHNQQLTQVTIQQKESLEESQRKIQELEKEKQAQASVVTELQKCSEAYKCEMEALKQEVNKDVAQEVAELKRQQKANLKETQCDMEREVAGLRKLQNRKLYCSLCLMSCLCICFTLFFLLPWKQASENQALKLQDADSELRRQLNESLEESQCKIKQLEREKHINKCEVDLLKQRMEEEVAELRRQQKESLEKKST